jgi:hypothetical protein
VVLTERCQDLEKHLLGGAGSRQLLLKRVRNRGASCQVKCGLARHAANTFKFALPEVCSNSHSVPTHACVLINCLRQEGSHPENPHMPTFVAWTAAVATQLHVQNPTERSHKAIRITDM